MLSASNPGCTRTSYGGVGRNVAVKIAEVLAREGEGGTGTKGTIGHGEVSLVSIVGADGAGKGLLQHLQEAKVDGSHVVVATSGVHGTARYVLLNYKLWTISYRVVHWRANDGILLSYRTIYHQHDTNTNTNIHLYNNPIITFQVHCGARHRR